MKDKKRYKIHFRDSNGIEQVAGFCSTKRVARKILQGAASDLIENYPMYAVSGFARNKVTLVDTETNILIGIWEIVKIKRKG